jgi:hypothetical protein
MAFKTFKLGTVLALFALIGVVTLILLASYSTVPQTALGWIALFVIGIPSWVLLEMLGDFVLSAKVFSRLSSAARIALAVPAVIVVGVVGVAIFEFGRFIISSL